jgi:hypothetical protein
LVATLGIFIVSTPRVHAAELTSTQLQAEAEKACGKNDDEPKPACRNGFREGYKGDKTVKEACTDRSTYSDKEKEACKDAYAEGKALKVNSASGPGLAGSSAKGTHQCGKVSPVKTKFDFGCLGDKAPDGTGPIQDVAYSVLRFLSVGVGIVVVASIIYAGIMYSTSQGSAEQTAAAKDRIQNAIIGLVFYMFIFALVQFLVPGGVFAGSIYTLNPDLIILRT